MVLDYLKQNQAQITPGSFNGPRLLAGLDDALDPATVRNLELPALVELVDRTLTPIGARRLRAWVGAPMRDAESIELRLGAVAELAASADLREALSRALKPVG